MLYRKPAQLSSGTKISIQPAKSCPRAVFGNVHILLVRCRHWRLSLKMQKSVVTSSFLLFHASLSARPLIKHQNAWVDSTSTVGQAGLLCMQI